VPGNIFDTYNPTIVSLRAREPNNKSARIQQFNVAAQVLLPLQSSFELAYVGNRGTNELAEFSANQVPFGLDGSVAANRPYPAWSQITVGATRSNSWYNALQAKFEKRLTHGWYTLVSYTYASALDQYGVWSANFTPQYLDDFAAEKGPNSQVPRQRLSWSETWQLPYGHGRQFGSNASKLADGILGGWQLSHILTWRTGLPVNVTLASSGTNPATGKTYSFLNRNGGSLRPDLIGDPNTGVDPKTNRLTFLSPGAFLVQPVNTPGNAQRDLAVGPRSFTTNISLVKSFRVVEGQSLGFRFEAFNLFNNVNFGLPSASFGSSSFGQITSAADPRVVQLAIRYRF
jgi:hypothetical protein